MTAMHKSLWHMIIGENQVDEDDPEHANEAEGNDLLS